MLASEAAPVKSRNTMPMNFCLVLLTAVVSAVRYASVVGTQVSCQTAVVAAHMPLETSQFVSNQMLLCA